MRRAAFLLLLWVAPGAAGAPPADELPLADLLQVLVLERELVALDARSGGGPTVGLQRGERVRWSGAHGAVGVALTDKRVLAVAVDSAAWQQERLLQGERPPARALLEDRVALILTSHRLLGFDGGSGNLVEARLGVRERVLDQRLAENAAVVVTDRRALGLSPRAGGFFQADLLLSESLEALSASGNLVTVTTDRRILVFRGPTGTWEERRR